MKLRFAVIVAICACAALILVSAAQTLAQENKAAAKPIRYSGTVKVIDKATKTFTIQSKTAGIQIKYTDKTTFTYRKQPSTIDEVKEGRRVIVLIDAAQPKDMVATRVDVRE